MSAMERFLGFPHAIIALALVGVVAGLLAYATLPMYLFPDTNRPVIAISTQDINPPWICHRQKRADQTTGSGPYFHRSSGPDVSIHRGERRDSWDFKGPACQISS